MPPFYSYLITDPACYGAAPDVFAVRLEAALRAHRPDFALYRDKRNPDYARTAARFLEVCGRSGCTRGLLHGDIALARRLGAYGVHLTSGQGEEIAAAKRAGLFTVISTHSEGEILRAMRQGADAVTYSPVFASPGKGEPKGLEDLKDKTAKIGLPIIALGGIVGPEQIEAVRCAGAAGFASIRYFCPKSTSHE